MKNSAQNAGDDAEDRAGDEAANGRAAEERYRRLAERMQIATRAGGVAVWEWDLLRDEQVWDARMFEFYGLPDAEAAPRGEDFLSLIHPEDRGAAVARFAAVLQHDGIFDFEFRTVRDGVEGRTLRSLASVVRDERGAPLRVVGTNTDVTEMRKLEASLRASEARYRLMADNTTDIIVTTGLNGRTTFASAACEAITGYRPEDMMGRKAMDFADPEDVARVTQVFSGLLKGEAPERARWRVRHKTTGARIWLESHPSLIRDPATGQPTGFLDAIRDVTPQVAQEEALALARRNAEAAAAVKSAFLANMSHEIRTPLTAILGFTRLLQERPNADEVSRGYLKRVSAAGDALMSIVNDVLDFSKLEAGEVKIIPRPTETIDLLRGALLMFEPQAEAKGLSLRFEAAPGVPACLALDPDRIRQVLLNLIGNAVKFTEAGTVTLTAAYDHAAGALEIAVGDTGPGLTRAEQAQLFKRFSQIDASSTRRHGGTGLGLAICKGLAEAMGGRVGVTSRPGEGSVFSIRVLASQAVLPSAANPDAAAADLDGLRVLVVDDNQTNRDLVIAILGAQGAEITEAVDGQGGVEAAQIEPFDVILMDFRMPRLDGGQAALAIRNGGGPNADVPILGFSADADLSHLGGGPVFDGVVRKPIVPRDLMAAVALAVGPSQAPDDVPMRVAHAVGR